MPAAELDSPRAWTVAAAGALASGTAFGTAYSFGAVFDAMADDLDASRGSAALMFGVTLFLFFGLGFVALGPEVSAVLFGVIGLGSVMGLQFLGAGLGGLGGPPLAGWLADASDGRTAPIVLALAVSVVVFFLSLAIPTRCVGTAPG